jgi:hypothetical protein
VDRGRRHQRRQAPAAGALLASSVTLVCCVLPAVLVALGAGAALAGLVTAVPQLVWLSEHKPLVFGSAAALLAVSGIALWYGRKLVSDRSCCGASVPKSTAHQCATLRPGARELRVGHRVCLRTAGPALGDMNSDGLSWMP